jgi:hypothetical protein
MKQWEYQLVKAPSGVPITNIEDDLDALGKDGWELCGIHYGYFILKREKQEESASIGESPSK